MMGARLLVLHGARRRPRALYGSRRDPAAHHHHGTTALTRMRARPPGFPRRRGAGSGPIERPNAGGRLNKAKR